MTREAIEYFKFQRKIFCDDHLKICPKDSIAYQATLKEKEFYNMAIKALEQESKWIPVKTRPLTDAEKADMLENSNYFFNYAFDCRIPEDGEEVLITTSAGEVTTTVFCNEGLDGCYFEYYEDDDDVIAWMPKPKPYKAESEG